VATAALPGFWTGAPVWRHWPALAVAVLALACVAINPVGFIGGGFDDVHYLDASRCWVAAGQPCLPQSHWASRWPAVAPLAIFTGLFGETRLTVGLGPLLAWVACIALMYAIGRAWFDRATGYIAAALLAATPVVTQSALTPGVDTTELALQLGALLLATLAYNQRSIAFSIAAGAVAGVAVEARDTSLLFCGAAGIAWFLLEPERRRVLLWSVVGFAAVFAIDFAVYAAATGNPFFRYRLALGHTSVPSVELATNVDTSRSPLFNPAYIAGWRREAGIAVWWPVDPWLNLLASPRIGFLLGGMLLMLPIGWQALPPTWKRLGTRTLAFAMLVSVGLVYVLAVDPKSRMFLLLVAASALTVAAMTVSSWRAGRGLVPGCVVALLVLGGLDVLSLTVNTHDFEIQARRWIRENPGAVEIDPSTTSTLTLVPEARALPLAGSGRPLRIHGTNIGCNALDAPIVARIGEKATGELCLLRLKR
jgi:4-amino-4-deoxy-L-arabinose transferase-like glycosyltransferase